MHRKEKKKTKTKSDEEKILNYLSDNDNDRKMKEREVKGQSIIILCQICNSKNKIVIESSSNSIRYRCVKCKNNLPEIAIEKK